MSHYDLLVFGCPHQADLNEFVAALNDLMRDSDIPAGDVRVVTDASKYVSLNPRRPTVCACFSAATADELAVVRSLREARAPVIPVARSGERFEDFPMDLQALNGATLPDSRNDWPITAAAVLEAAGLLRAQRRLFVSYRREEAREPALQLHDELSGRGFQVFLDTHSIRPGKVFQEHLWHSLCDSDVMLMLDTKSYFDSKWTREEFGRAQSMGVNIFRLVFPCFTKNNATGFTAFHTLKDTDFVGEKLNDTMIDQVVARIEAVRARGIATRLTAMTGKLKAEVEAAGGRIEGTGAFRSIALTLKDGDQVWAYPVIGVPTANLMHDVAQRAEAANQKGPYLVYDHVGITDDWLDHLAWLDDTISSVDFMRVSDTASILSERGSR